VTDRASTWVPPRSEVTQPDQIPAEAWRAITLIDGEMPLQAWHSAHGFLVLTNLRCFGLWREWELFPPRSWHTGPEFFFYNLRPPRVLFGRFVELSEEFQEAGTVGRFAVHDPVSVASAISAALEPGRGIWKERRKTTEELMQARRQIRAALAAGRPPPVVKVRCSFCGNLADATSRRCPSCGAALI
jgi:hypothetical protein